MRSLLSRAPLERSLAAKASPLVLALPGSQRRLPALRARGVADHGARARREAPRHQDLQRPRHRRPDRHDPRRPHARSGSTPRCARRQGAWYIDPYYHLDQSLYVELLRARPDREPARRVRRARRRTRPSSRSTTATTTPPTPSRSTASGFAANTAITITISDPRGAFATRTLERDDRRAAAPSTPSFAADPGGNLDTHVVEANDGDALGSASYQVVRDDDPTTDPPTGDVLRTTGSP